MQRVRNPETAATDVVRVMAPSFADGARRTRQGLWQRFRCDHAGLVGLLGILIWLAVALCAPWLSPHDPNFQFDAGLSSVGLPVGPTAMFPLGTDTAGRDLLSRLLFGARVSCLVGIVATLLLVAVGVTLGAIAGYYGGWRASLVLWLTDMMLAFPVVLLGMAVAAIVSPSIIVTIVVIALTQWMYMARMVYSVVQGLREREFVVAAHALGVSDARVLWRHLLPHLAPLSITYGTLSVGSSILLESTLSFLNAGVPPPTASWGSMISDGLTSYQTTPTLVLYPGLVLAGVVLAFMVVGDALSRSLDAR